MAESQFCVIEAEQLQQGRMEIMDVDRIFDRLESKIIGRAVNISATDAATRQPHRETVMIMIATIDLPGVCAGSG